MALTAQQRLARCYQRRRETSEPGLNGEARRLRTDLGLVLLSMRAKRGVPITRDDIALWCGCTHEAIRRIEINALRKIRNRRAHMLRGYAPAKAA